MDEDLADAVDNAFYEHYRTWKLDHPDASTNKQVNCPNEANFMTPNQIRQWVDSWYAHFGDRATPKALVGVITRKKLTQATELKDKIERFQLLAPCEDKVHRTIIH